MLSCYKCKDIKNKLEFLYKNKKEQNPLRPAPETCYLLLCGAVGFLRDCWRTPGSAFGAADISCFMPTFHINTVIIIELFSWVMENKIAVHTRSNQIVV